MQYVPLHVHSLHVSGPHFMEGGGGPMNLHLPPTVLSSGPLFASRLGFHRLIPTRRFVATTQHSPVVATPLRRAFGSITSPLPPWTNRMDAFCAAIPEQNISLLLTLTRVGAVRIAQTPYIAVRAGHRRGQTLAELLLNDASLTRHHHYHNCAFSFTCCHCPPPPFAPTWCVDMACLAPICGGHA